MCAWGSSGAVAMEVPAAAANSDSTAPPAFIRSPSFPPHGGVVDTLGAGDTFIGAMIVGLGSGMPVETALTYACRVAGKKCGVRGLALSHVLEPEDRVCGKV